MRHALRAAERCRTGFSGLSPTWDEAVAESHRVRVALLAAGAPVPGRREWLIGGLR